MSTTSKLYVGNIPYWSDISVEDAEKKIEDVFNSFGVVKSVKIVKDWETNKSKGFGFVEMATKEDAQRAIDSLHGSELAGRKMVVNEAKERILNTSGGPNKYVKHNTYQGSNYNGDDWAGDTSDSKTRW